MLDLRLIRSDTERRARGARAPGRRTARSTRCWRSTSAGARCRPRSTSCAPSATARRRRSARPSAPGATPREEIACSGRPARPAGRGSRTRLRRGRPRCFDGALLELPNLPARDRGRRHDRGGRGEVVRVGRRAARSSTFEPRDHLELAGPMIDMERGARTSGSRFAYLLGDLVRLHLATVQYTLDKLAEQGFTPGACRPCSCARRRSSARASSRPTASRSTPLDPARDELFLVGTSEVSLAALHMGEILRRGLAAAALLRRLVVLPPRGRRGRHATRAASSARTSSRRSRCSRSAIPDRSLGGARAAARHRARDRRRPRPALPRGEHRGRRPRRLRRPRSTTSRPGCPGQGRYRELTSCSNTTDYQARRLDAPLSHRARARASCTR